MTREQLLQRLLAGGDVHVELLEVVEVELVHLVEHGHVLEQRHARALERVDDAVDAGGDLLVAGGEAVEGVGEPAEDGDPRHPGAAAERVDVDLAHLLEQVGERLAAGAGVLVAHVAEQRVGEVGDAALGGQAVAEHALRVAHVDAVLDLGDAGQVVGGERAGDRRAPRARVRPARQRAGGRRRGRHVARRLAPSRSRRSSKPPGLAVHGLAAHGALEQLDLAVEVEGTVFEHVGELAVEGLLHDVQRGLGAGHRLRDLRR